MAARGECGDYGFVRLVRQIWGAHTLVSNGLDLGIEGLDALLRFGDDGRGDRGCHCRYRRSIAAIDGG